MKKLFVIGMIVGAGALTAGFLSYSPRTASPQTTQQMEPTEKAGHLESNEERF
jgi:hypothetical protein